MLDPTAPAVTEITEFLRTSALFKPTRSAKACGYSPSSMAMTKLFRRNKRWYDEISSELWRIRGALPADVKAAADAFANKFAGDEVLVTCPLNLRNDPGFQSVVTGETFTIVLHRLVEGTMDCLAERMTRAYLDGYLPCGWSGTFPDGKLLVATVSDVPQEVLDGPPPHPDNAVDRVPPVPEWQHHQLLRAAKSTLSGRPEHLAMDLPTMEVAKLEVTDADQPLQLTVTMKKTATHFAEITFPDIAWLSTALIGSEAHVSLQSVEVLPRDAVPPPHRAAHGERTCYRLLLSDGSEYLFGSGPVVVRRI